MEWGNAWWMDVTQEMRLQTCTYAPYSDGSFKPPILPPTYEEMSDFFDSMNIYLSEEAYTFILEGM